MNMNVKNADTGLNFSRGTVKKNLINAQNAEVLLENSFPWVLGLYSKAQGFIPQITKSKRLKNLKKNQRIPAQHVVAEPVQPVIRWKSKK